MKYIGVSKISAGCSAGLFCTVVLPLAASGASSGSLCRRGQTEQLLCAPRGLASSPAAQGMLLRVSQHENMTERCSLSSGSMPQQSPIYQKNTQRGLHVLSECCESQGETFPPAWGQAQTQTQQQPFSKTFCDRSL